VLLACENHAGFVYTAVMKSTKPVFISVYTLVGSSEVANVSNHTVITGMHAAVADLHQGYSADLFPVTQRRRTKTNRQPMS